MDLQVKRYDPRKNHNELIALISECLNNIDVALLEKTIKERSRDVLERNGMLVVYDGEEVVGAGFYSKAKNFLGEMHCLVHKPIVKAGLEYKNGIEEAVYRELFKYIKGTLGLTNTYLLLAPDDIRGQSQFMKLGIKESKTKYYTHQL